VPRPGRDGKPSRTYRSPQRSAQARRTRERIIAAATDQFVTAGYSATTMRSIAAASGVSVASIELTFGTKVELLKVAIDVAIAGDHEPVAVLNRSWATRAQTTTSVTQLLTVVARTLRPAMARSAGLVVAAQDAARSDPQVQQLAEQLTAQRAATVAWIVDHIRERGPLRQGTTRRDAIDQVWLFIDPAVYQRLTRYRGWSPTRYQRWFVDTVTRLLVD
jgi:TetR/AcrR family transcriptional regulator, regulator of autoinduction and epiphytic fitness